MQPVEVTHVSPAAFGDRGQWGGGERYPLALALAMSAHVPTRLVVFARRRARLRLGPLEILQLPIRALYKQGSVSPLSELLPVAIARARRLHLHQYHSVTTNLTLAFAWAARRPAYCTDHGGASYDYGDRLGLQRLVTGFLPVSCFSAGFFPQLADRTASPLLGGADVARFYPGSEARRRGVVYVGRILPHKGLDVLLAAVDDRTPVRIYGRTGDPAYRARLARLAAGKDVVFCGGACDAEIAQAYRRARVAVLPSVHRACDGSYHPWPELLGLTLLEAMASGTPVVASRIGGVPEIVDDGRVGYLVAPGHPEALGEAIGALLEPTRRWRAMSDAAVTTVRERFTWDHVARRCLDGYEAIRGLGSGGRGSDAPSPGVRTRG